MSTEGDTFGQECQLMGITLEGNVDLAEGKFLVAEIVARLHMTPAHEPILYAYPTDDAKGGRGYTYIQPITESYIALDAWPDWNGGYLVICSCIPFPSEVALRALRQNGYFVLSHFTHTMRLSHNVGAPVLIPTD